MSKKSKLIDLDKAKEQIVTEIISSSEFKRKLKFHAFKAGITTKSKILEDVMQEIAMKSLEKDSEFIFDLYCNPKKNGDNRVFAYMLRMGVMMMLDHPQGYSNHNITTKIKHMSNLKSDDVDVFEISEKDKIELPTWIDEGDAEVEQENEQHIMRYLMQFLEPSEVEFLELEMNKDITKGKFKQEYKIEKERIFEKLRQIAKNKKLNFD